MAISVNGMIAKSDDNTSWITPEEWRSYSLFVRKAGNLIVGRRTYEILTKQPEFAEFKDIKLVVVSKKQDINLVSRKHLIAESPKKALTFLKNFKRIVVAGGGTLNNSFLEENLIDEIYLDVEPIIITTGIPLFKGKEFVKNLKFINQQKISENEIQLHYTIVK